MGFVSNLLNPAQGAGFQATAAPIAQGTNAAQVQGATATTQQNMAQQQALLQALQAQNGLQNQSSVYNQLQDVASGTGPNPAQAQLAQATGANVANQAALMAGQRGAGTNAGLIARQAAQQGANTQQQAAGQAATLQAQQSLGALGQMGGLATTQAGQQIGQVNTGAQTALAQQQNLLGALGQQNQSTVAMQSNVNAQNAAIAQANQQAQAGGIGGLLNAAGGVGSMLLGPAAGVVAGGLANMLKGSPSPTPQGAGMVVPSGGQTPTTPQNNQAHGGMIEVYAKGGMPTTPMLQNNKIPGGVDPISFVNSLKRPGSKKMLAGGGPVIGEQLAAQGKMVPGQAKVSGDSETNDIVDAKLSPGEIVIPRTIAQGANAPTKAAQFVQQVLAKKAKGRK